VPENILKSGLMQVESAMVEPEEQIIIKAFQIDLARRADRSWSI